jgi:hypothetical protein
VTLRLPSRPLLALAALALLAPVGASAANPSPTPVAAPSNPTPVAATPSTPSTTTTPSTPTRTYTRSYTPPARTSTGPTAAQLAAQRAAKAKSKAQAKARVLAAQRHKHQTQLLAAAQTHAEAVAHEQLAAARKTDAVDTLAVSVADSIGAVPAGDLPRAAAATPSASGGGGASLPLPALLLAACAGLLGIAAAFTARRGVGFATASLLLLVLLLAGI